MFQILKNIGAALITIAAFLLNACVNPHRRFSGPIVEPVWTIPNLAVTQQPVVHEGIVYFFAKKPGSAKALQNLYAFDLATRKQLWVSTFVPGEQIKFIAGPRLFVLDDKHIGHTLDRKTGQELLPPAASTMRAALVAGDTIYATWDNGSVTAMDFAQKTRWTAQVPISLDRIYGLVLSAGNVVVFGNFLDDAKASHGSALYAFDQKDGAQRWKWERKQDNQYAGRLEADASAVYFSLHADARLIVALDSATGKEKWKVPARPRATYDGPVLSDPATLLVLDSPPGAGDFDQASGFLIRALKPSTGEPLWESKTRWKYSDWEVSGGSLYASDSEDHSWFSRYSHPVYPWPADSWLSHVDLRSGKETWRCKTAVNTFFTKPALAEGLVIIGVSPWVLYPEPAGLMAFRARGGGK